MCDCSYHTPHPLDGPEYCNSPRHRADANDDIGGEHKVDALDGVFKRIESCRNCHAQCQIGTMQCVRYPRGWQKERTFGCPMCLTLCQTDRRHTWQWDNGYLSYWWREEKAGPIVIDGEPCPCQDHRCTCIKHYNTDPNAYDEFRCGKIAEKQFQTAVYSFVSDHYDNLGAPYWCKYDATICNACLAGCYNKPLRRDSEGNAMWGQDHTYGPACGTYHGVGRFA